jgi:hypothetical protein
MVKNICENNSPTYLVHVCTHMYKPRLQTELPTCHHRVDRGQQGPTRLESGTPVTVTSHVTLLRASVGLGLHRCLVCRVR